MAVDLKKPVVPMQAISERRPVPSMSHCARAAASKVADWQKVCRSVVWGARIHVGLMLWWSLRLRPTAGRLSRTGMECFSTSEAGPMPERRSSLGVLRAPAEDDLGSSEEFCTLQCLDPDGLEWVGGREQDTSDVRVG